MKSSTIATLLVESDQRRASHLIGLLRSASDPAVEVHVVVSLSEGMQLAEVGAFDAILTRLRLPDARGLETLVRLQGLGPQRPPVIALLEDEEKHVILDAAQSLADDCLFYGDLDTELLQRSLTLAIDRREMLRDLRQKQASVATGSSPFQAMLNHFDEALFLVSRADGKLVFVNQVARAWFGEGLGETLADLLDYGVLLGEDLEIEIETGNPQIPHAELRSVALDWQGQACCLVSLRNISKRKRAEEAYKASQRRLDLALKASNVGLWSWDLRGHQLQYSERWKAQLGYKPHEFPHTLSAFRRCLHPEDKEGALSSFRAILKGDKRDVECKFRLQHADGSYRLILCRAEVFPDGDGRLAMVLGTHIDVTERSRSVASLAESQQAQRAATAELAQRLSQRFEAVALELESTATELRTFFRSDSAISARIQDIESLSKRAAALNDLLRSDVGDGESGPIELGSLVERSREALQRLVPRKAFVSLEFQDAAALPGFERRYVDLLLAETVAVVGRQTRSEIRSRVDLRVIGPGLPGFGDLGQLEIEYCGAALPDADFAELPRCDGVTFERGEAGDRRFLRIVFSLSVAELPRAQAVAALVAGSRKVALLAEDEGVLSFAIRSMLESQGFEVVLAEDGARAIDLFFERADDYTLALVDLHMPVIDGYSVVKSLRSRRPDLPILKMSGDDADSIGDTFGLDDPHCCFLSKPFGVSELKAAVAGMASGYASEYERRGPVLR